LTTSPSPKNSATAAPGYDFSALYLGMWSTLVQAAERTNTIGLCSGAAIPALRHVIFSASAILWGSKTRSGG
jgi:hypothetical protein